MPRRASSGPNVIAVIGIVAFLVVSFFGIRYFLKGSGEKMKGVAKMKVDDFCENGNSFRGNEYLIQGTVDQRWPRDEGQVVSLLDEESEALIGIEIPAQFNSLNIEREQKLSIKVRVREGGIPVALDIQRQ
jgi:hypothetical protein